MSEIRDKAKRLLAARRQLIAEQQEQQHRQRTTAKRSRQQLRRKRAAEQVASDRLSTVLPVAVTMTRRKLAALHLQATTLPDLLSKPELSDLELRISHSLKSGGKVGKAAYWTDLGPAPDCAPGDITTARIFHRRIRRVLDLGGWSRVERAALCVLEKRWRLRADGQDARFMVAGTAGSGRLPAHVERAIRLKRGSNGQ